MSGLQGKTLFITGASRGIGLAIALRAARDGANVAVVAKTVEPHKTLPGTIHTAAAEIEAAGGRALAIAADIRDEAAVEAAAAATAERFGGIDVCINNASAIQLTGTEETTPRRFDLMFGVNARGTFVATRACLPWLKRADNPHVLMLSPPLDLQARWFAPHVAYSITKYGMSLCALGMAEEFRPLGIAVNALWPRTIIATSARRQLPEELRDGCRSPEIVADAAHWILTRPARDCSGRFLIDEDALREAGVEDFDRYAITPGMLLTPDLFVDAWS